MTKKRMLTIALAAMMLFGGVAAFAATNDTSALDAFATIAGKTVETGAIGMTSDDYLDQVMEDLYASAPADKTAAAKMAPALDGLSGVTTKDIAVYAATKQLPAEQVRNKYYRSLANVLKAEIMINPAVEENYKNIETILSLFLSTDQDNLTKVSRDAVRSSITKAHTQTIAQGYNVPQSFVEFVIMDDSWNDDNWENDSQWRTTSNWNTDDLTPDSLDDYVNTRNTPNTPNDVNTPNTPNDVNTPNTPDYNTPDRNTPDYNTPNTPDYNTPNTPDYNTPDRNTPNSPNTPRRNTLNTPNSPDTRD